MSHVGPRRQGGMAWLKHTPRTRRTHTVGLLPLQFPTSANSVKFRNWVRNSARLKIIREICKIWGPRAPNGSALPKLSTPVSFDSPGPPFYLTDPISWYTVWVKRGGCSSARSRSASRRDSRPDRHTTCARSHTTWRSRRSRLRVEVRTVGFSIALRGAPSPDTTGRRTSELESDRAVGP